jgi:methionyl-tRNA formyltransferase
MKIQILISKNSWANDYKDYLKIKLRKFAKKIFFFNNHQKLNKNFDVNIIFSYFNIISNSYLSYSKYNLICHESDLPKGRGMSAITWQLLKNSDKITFSLIDAGNKIDSGNIYFQKKVKIKKTLLFDEIKFIQLKENTLFLIKFLKVFKLKKKFLSRKQIGKPTYFPRRSYKDNKININKSVKSQFNLLRLSDNNFYPNFFYYKNKKFFLKIYKK